MNYSHEMFTFQWKEEGSTMWIKMMQTCLWYGAVFGIKLKLKAYVGMRGRKKSSK